MEPVSSISDPLEEKRLAVVNSADNVRFYVNGVIIVVAFAFIAAVVLAIFAPEQQSTMFAVMGLATSICIGLFGKAILNVAIAQDGQKSQLVRLVARSERAEGALDGMALNPRVNVTEEDVNKLKG